MVPRLPREVATAARGFAMSEKPAGGVGGPGDRPGGCGAGEPQVLAQPREA
jgi:hypothetical protein